MNQIYFTSDLHFGHSNILKHSPKRPYSDTVDIASGGLAYEHGEAEGVY